MVQISDKLSRAVWLTHSGGHRAAHFTPPGTTQFMQVELTRTGETEGLTLAVRPAEGDTPSLGYNLYFHHTPDEACLRLQPIRRFSNEEIEALPIDQLTNPALIEVDTQALGAVQRAARRAARDGRIDSIEQTQLYRLAGQIHAALQDGILSREDIADINAQADLLAPFPKQHKRPARRAV